MKLRYWIFALLFAVLFSAPSMAEEPPWYEVEIIVFIRDVQPDSLNEAWPVDPGLPDFEHAQPLQPEGAAEIQPNETENGLGIENPAGAVPAVAEESAVDASKLPVPIGQRLPVPYTLIPESDYRLKTEFRRLKLSDALQPVMHLAWRQPVTDPKHAKLLYLRADKPYAKAASSFESTAPIEAIDLEGTIRISVNRYLHVELDLLNQIKQRRLYSSYEQSFGNGYAEESLVESRYRMQDKRRMRSGELHYIDHPLMGALVKITPYELPKPVPIVPVEPETVDQPVTEEAHTEEADTTETNETAAKQEVEPVSQEPGVTTTVIEIPAKNDE